MYVCRHFKIHELVPPNVFIERGEKAWQLLDARMLRTIDHLRDKFGSITINNYQFGGKRKESGLRTPDCKYYSQFSQHSYGRAFDLLFNDSEITVEEIRQYILSHKEEFPHITGVELDVSWLHIDCRNAEQFYAFYP